MSAIVLQIRRPASVTIGATAIGPFDSFEEADCHATELCRNFGDEYVYSVFTLVPPGTTEK